MISAAAFLVTMLGAFPQAVRANGCKAVGDDVRTNWSADVVTVSEPGPFRSLHGVVHQANSSLAEGILVEVYDHPEMVNDLIDDRLRGQKRLGACLTGKHGKFSFVAEPGKYELRFSGSMPHGWGEWSVTSIPVEVSKTARSNKKIIVNLHVAH